MNREIQYPIKYTYLPIYKKINNDQLIFHGSIIVKCYILEENRSFKKNGEEIIEYKVLFPYRKPYLYVDLENLLDTYSYECGWPSNTTVTEIYDNYQEAVDNSKNIAMDYELIEIEKIINNNTDNLEIDKSKVLSRKIK